MIENATYKYKFTKDEVIEKLFIEKYFEILTYSINPSDIAFKVNLRNVRNLKIDSLNFNDEYRRIIKNIFDNSIQQPNYINYAEYIAENLDKSINYSEYISENLSPINYSEYISENLNTIDYTKYLAENLDDVTQYHTYSEYVSQEIAPNTLAKNTTKNG